MPKTWLRQLEADHLALLAHRAGRPPTRALAAAAPRLADSRHAEQLDAVIDRDVGDAAGLDVSLAAGRRALVHNRPDDALRWLVRAQSLAGPQAPAFVARIAFLLGAIHLDRDEDVATDAVLAWAEGLLGAKAESSADLLHLRALMAERRGERDAAVALYRRVLRWSSAALTPLTRVLAMRNLAATLAHATPRESAGLYGMSLATLDAEELDPSLRCTIDNGMGYALLCAGDIDGARLKLDHAVAEARRVGNERVAVYARFNAAIVDELRGDLATADASLRAVERDAVRRGLEELAGWTRIRRAWLLWRSGDREAAERALRDGFPTSPRTEHREAIATLNALLRLQERPAASRAKLAALAQDYRRRDDALTDFTLSLWIAHTDAASGRVAAARRNVARACELGSARGFRLGTSWWSSELVAIARQHAPDELADFADRLLDAPATPQPERQHAVALSREGSVTIDGKMLDDASWREGRSGSGVLRRYFRALVAAYPAAPTRDELADLLWPESEGDKAVRNLYDATKDLRRVLAGIPGVRLIVSDRAYGLALGKDVRLG